MNTLTETTLKINTYPDWYVAGIVSEVLEAAAAYYTEYPGLAWETVCQIFLDVRGRHEGIDLSATPIPPAPMPSIDEINAALLDDPDYADFLAQTNSGIPMF